MVRAVTDSSQPSQQAYPTYVISLHKPYARCRPYSCGAGRAISDPAGSESGLAQGWASPAVLSRTRRGASRASPRAGPRRPCYLGPGGERVGPRPGLGLAGRAISDPAGSESGLAQGWASPAVLSRTRRGASRASPRAGPRPGLGLAGRAISDPAGSESGLAQGWASPAVLSRTRRGASRASPRAGPRPGLGLAGRAISDPAGSESGLAQGWASPRAGPRRPWQHDIDTDTHPTSKHRPTDRCQNLFATLQIYCIHIM